jgi:DNA-directed RNA polymerase I, II, and III subunit RPABC2
MSSNYSSEILSDKDIRKLIVEQKKISMPFLTKYEKARLLGLRIKQLTSGSLPLIDTTGFTNFIDIAEEELKQKKTPLIIKRRMPNDKYEYWKINELIQLN